MLDRRSFVTGFGAAVMSPSVALAKSNGFKLDPKYEPQKVLFDDGDYAPGTIVVDPENRFLYLTEGNGIATRYGVGVGKAGLELKGTAYIARKAKWPFWRPTREMIRRSPGKYARYAKGMRGGPNNPLGARALYLYRGQQDTYYRIHGTNQPRSIGHALSNGCVRMLNDHVAELYERVPVGTFVVIL
jgi:lipoprotein-anchoring transpeptidase ErfK/SrfK